MASLLKRIHVNQHIIKSNMTRGENQPTLTIKTSLANIKANRVDILGPSVLQYSSKPLDCGARVWIETHATVLADGQEIS